MRAIDWSTTPLGPVAALAAEPQDLRAHHAHLAPADVRLVGRGAHQPLQRRLQVRSSAASIPRRSASRRRVVWREIWDEVGPRAAVGDARQRGHLRRGAAADHGAQRLPGGDLLHLLVQPGAERRGRHRRHHLRQHRRHASASSASGSWRCCASSRRAPPTRARSTSVRAQRARRSPPTRTICRSRCIYVADGDSARLTLRRRAGIARGHAAAPATIALDDASSWPLARGRCAREVGRRRRLERTLRRRCRRGAWDASADARGGRCRSRRRARPGAPACSSSGSIRFACSTTAIAASSSSSPARSRASIAQRAGLRGGAPARRGAGRARSRQDRVLLQRQPRVPHAAHADARPARGRAARSPERGARAASELADACIATRCACSSSSTRCSTSRASRPAASQASLRADRPRRAHRRARQRVPLGDRARRAALRRRLRAAARAGLRRPRHVGEDRPQPALERVQVHVRGRDRASTLRARRRPRRARR